MPIAIIAALGALAATPLSAAPEPLAPESLAEVAWARYTDDLVDEAVALLEAHLTRAPDDHGAWVRLGEIQRRRCALTEARAIYDRLLGRDLRDPDARAGLAEIDLLLANPQRALAQATLALSTTEGRRSGAAWRARTMALIDLGRYDAAREAGAHGVRVAPDDPRVLESYARAAFRSGDMEEARAAYARATRLDPAAEQSHLRLGSGFGPNPAEHAWEGDRDRPLYEAAIEAWEHADLRAADRHFRELVARAPACFKYRLGLGLVRRALRRFHELRFGGDVSAAYLALPAPQAPRLSEFVENLDSLPAWARQVIRTSVAPAHEWIGALVKRGARHDILRLEDCLYDASARRHLEDQRTFDGRLYGHIRGVGGLYAATGIEKLRETSQLAFNTFAHEFAHQLLRYGFPEALFLEVRRLYGEARQEGRCLDYYAASNVDEYFAQGYEALVSHAKRGCLRDTGRHTRDELRERDPALHAFLIEHLDLSHEAEGKALAPFFAALPP